MKLGTIKNLRGQHEHYLVTDRFRHVYIVGKSGVGKSTLFENLIAQDFKTSAGICIIDIHGDLSEHLLELIPPSRKTDLIYFNVSDTDYPIGFNVLDDIESVLDTFKYLFANEWGPQFEQLLRYAVSAVSKTDDASLLGVKRILRDKKYRTRVIGYVRDPVVLDFWKREFPSWSAKDQIERPLSTLNKLDQFLANPIIRNIVSQKNRIDFQEIFTGRILICNLDRGKIGLGTAKLLGSFIVSKLHTAALKRTDRRPFHFYADEFHHFGGSIYADMLSGIRKFGVSLTLANQYMTQLPEELQDAIFGNCGTLVSFQVGNRDSKILSQEFDREDFTILKHRALVRQDGRTEEVYLSRPPRRKYASNAAYSRNRYGTPRQKVERLVQKFLKA